MDNPDEIFIVVDKNDKVKGYRTRYDCHHDKQLIHRAIGIMIFNKKGQILLQKRSKNTDLNSSLYTLSASGHVNKRESYLKAAKRELKEELGIQIPLKKRLKFLLEIPQETEMDYLFTGEYEGPFYPNSQEVEMVKFANLKELPNMISQLDTFAVLSLKQVSIL